MAQTAVVGASRVPQARATWNAIFLVYKGGAWLAAHARVSWRTCFYISYRYIRRH